MFRLLRSHHQGACYMVQCKRTMCILSRNGYLDYCSPVMILSCDKITNEVLNMFYCLVLLSSKRKEKKRKLGHGVEYNSG